MFIFKAQSHINTFSWTGTLAGITTKKGQANLTSQVQDIKSIEWLRIPLVTQVNQVSNWDTVIYLQKEFHKV